MHFRNLVFDFKTGLFPWFCLSFHIHFGGVVPFPTFPGKTTPRKQRGGTQYEYESKLGENYLRPVITVQQQYNKAK